MVVREAWFLFPPLAKGGEGGFQAVLPKDPEERKKVIFLRIFYDRDIPDQKEWIRREPTNQKSVPQHKEP